MGRYSKQIRLKGFGAAGQKYLEEARLLIVGMGGLGVPAAQYLNAMGLGTLGLIDGDSVTLSNLHRQVIYDEKDIGHLKVEVAAKKLGNQNPKTTIHQYPYHLTADNALDICKNYDLILDASDNFGTRYLVNDVAVLLDIPFIYAALHGWEGQISVFNYQNGPTYRCVFPNPPSMGSIPNCDTYGVLGVLPGILGAMQGLEAVKTILKLEDVISGKLLLYNSLHGLLETITLPERQPVSNIDVLSTDYHILCPSEVSITSESFLSILEKDTPIQLIDVRTQEEFNEEHLPGSILIPLDEMESRLEEVEWHKPTYLVCQSGVRSQLAQQQLKLHLDGQEIPFLQGGLNELNALCS